MEGTRLDIVHLLQRSNGATVEEMSSAMSLAPATVRRHLDILQRDGIVSFRPVKKRRMGRPKYAYSLTETGQESLPKDYHRLLRFLLQEMYRLTPEDLVPGGEGNGLTDRLFARMAHHVAVERQAMLGDGNFQEKVDALMEVLLREQFFPQREDLDSSVRIQLLNCPFRSVALEDECVCAFDFHLISQITGAAVVREHCISDGDHTCAYLISRRDS